MEFLRVRVIVKRKNEEPEVGKFNFMMKDDIKDCEKVTATVELMLALEEGEQSAKEKGWLSAEEVEKELGL